MVVRVGDAVMRVSDVTRRLAALPTFQLGSLGKSPGEVRRRYVDTVLVPEMLYGAEASKRRLESRPDVVAKIRDARRRAMVDQIRRERAAQGIPEEELRNYFAEHRDEFEKPERLRIARILTEDEVAAKKVLADAHGVGGPERWTKLAREHSVDASTKMRGGNLGFVFPDGRTDVPQLRVDPSLYAAASGVKDGELVAEPVKEGNRFAVVWRRGTLPKVARTVDEERQHIYDVLLRRHVDAAVDALVADLRKKYWVTGDPSLLDGPLPGEAAPRLPVPAPRPSTSVDPVPRPTDRGLR